MLTNRNHCKIADQTIMAKQQPLFRLPFPFSCAKRFRLVTYSNQTDIDNRWDHMIRWYRSIDQLRNPVNTGLHVVVVSSSYFWALCACKSGTGAQLVRQIPFDIAQIVSNGGGFCLTRSLNSCLARFSIVCFCFLRVCLLRKCKLRCLQTGITNATRRL